MSKEYGECGVPGKGPTKRDIRQTLNGVRRLAGNNPIADVLEFRKEYKVVDVSQRNANAATVGIEPAGHSGEKPRSAHGSRSAWSKGPEVNIRLRYGRQSGEIDTVGWPERPVGRPRDEARKTGPSMTETIRAARAFFGPSQEDAADTDSPATEPAVSTAPDRDENDASAEIHGDAVPLAESADTAETNDTSETEATPTQAVADAPAVSRVHKLSALSMRNVTEDMPSTEDEADIVEESTEALLDEIACEIVEDALVEQDDTDTGEADGADEVPVDEPEEPARQHQQLFIEEDEPSTDEVAAGVASLLSEAEDAPAVDEPADAHETPGPETDDPVGDAAEAEVQEAVTVPLRRDRRPGPRLPIETMAAPDAATPGTGPRSARGRPANAPKWSASARHHMSDMLATSGRDPAPTMRGRAGVELPGIDLRPDRHRQSSAMILLGLPAMLLLGFGAAYVYHASTYDPSRVFDQARAAIPASIASIPGMGTSRPSRKISESIIQKQEAKVIAASMAPAEPLPPPVAPPIVDTVAAKAAPAVQKTTRIAKAETETVARVETKAAVKAPDRLPEATRIEPAAAALTSALMVAPAEGMQADPILPAPIEPLPLAPKAANETTVAAQPLPTSGEAATARPKPSGVTRNEPASKPTQVAALVPDSEPLPEAGGETGQLIARGNERMEIGDIAAARLLYELAAQSGSPVAATAMGRSYDPVYFMRVGVRGVKPDPTKARDWYEKAVSGGDATAEKDLQNLTAWLTRQ